MWLPQRIPALTLVLTFSPLAFDGALLAFRSHPYIVPVSPACVSLRLADFLGPQAKAELIFRSSLLHMLIPLIPKFCLHSRMEMFK